MPHCRLLLETIHLTDQFNKPPKRDRADKRAPRRLAHRRSFTSAGTAAALAGLRFGCLRYGT